MATYNKFNIFVQDVTRKVHNLNSDTLKVALTNSAPIATNTVLANITQIGTGNGYASGGSAVPNNTDSQTSGTDTLAGDAVVFTASGGTIGPFRYAVLYNATAAGGPLIAWWDYGSAVTLNSGDTFTVSFNNQATAGTIFTMV